VKYRCETRICYKSITQAVFTHSNEYNTDISIYHQKYSLTTIRIPQP